MRKCDCGERIKHLFSFYMFRGTQMRYAQRGQSDICILSGKQLCEFASLFGLTWSCLCRAGVPLFIKRMRELTSTLLTPLSRYDQSRYDHSRYDA